MNWLKRVIRRKSRHRRLSDKELAFLVAFTHIDAEMRGDDNAEPSPNVKRFVNRALGHTFFPVSTPEDPS